jgi:hypothetical protein
MTTDGKGSEARMSGEVVQGTHRARRPYVAPRLVYLGTVRELTLGCIGSGGDGFGAQRRSLPGCE